MTISTLMRTILFFLSLGAVVNAATTVNSAFMVSTTVPDNSIIGLADTRAIVSNITSITSVNIAITLAGGWNGDLYAYVSHASGFCVLLNRPGRSAALPDGSSSSGFDIRFTEAATADVHTSIPGNGLVTGDYQPDARNEDPLRVLDTSLRSAFLGSFTGLDPNGDWTLFVADISPGGTTVVENWTLTITGVPEPTSGLLVAYSALLLFIRRR